MLGPTTLFMLDLLLSPPPLFTDSAFKSPLMMTICIDYAKGVVYGVDSARGTVQHRLALQ